MSVIIDERDGMMAFRNVVMFDRRGKSEAAEFKMLLVAKNCLADKTCL